MGNDKESAAILDGLEAAVEGIARQMEALQIENRRLASAIVKVKSRMKDNVKKKEEGRSIKVGDRVLFCKKPTVKSYNGIGTVIKVAAKCVFIRDENEDEATSITIRRSKTNVKLR
jgi:hypothetical protein